MPYWRMLFRAFALPPVPDKQCRSPRIVSIVFGGHGTPCPYNDTTMDEEHCGIAVLRYWIQKLRSSEQPQINTVTTSFLCVPFPVDPSALRAPPLVKGRSFQGFPLKSTPCNKEASWRSWRHAHPLHPLGCPLDILTLEGLRRYGNDGAKIRTYFEMGEKSFAKV